MVEDTARVAVFVTKLNVGSEVKNLAGHRCKEDICTLLLANYKYLKKIENYYSI